MGAMSACVKCSRKWDISLPTTGFSDSDNGKRPPASLGQDVDIQGSSGREKRERILRMGTQIWGGGEGGGPGTMWRGGEGNGGRERVASWSVA